MLYGNLKKSILPADVKSQGLVFDTLSRTANSRGIPFPSLRWATIPHFSDTCLSAFGFSVVK